MARLRLLRVAGCSLIVANCASIVSDNDSTTYIETDPEEARCELHGQDFKRVVKTPNSINLPAAAAPISVACKADGYRTTVEPLDTEMDGWVFGNLLFGGIIGVVVDASRGAGQKFPSHVTVFLEPEVFASEVARDEWFDRRRNTIDQKWEKAINTIRDRCDTEDGLDNCDDAVEKAEAKRDAELKELEERRLRAGVRGKSA